MSLGHTRRRGVILGYTVNTQTLTKTDEHKEVLTKCTNLCWATFIATLGHIGPEGRGWDSPAAEKNTHCMLGEALAIVVRWIRAQFPESTQCRETATYYPRAVDSAYNLSATGVVPKVFTKFFQRITL